jgi:TPP-dependent pyruvate/acetoin dehydrogenase alpha subunit
MAESQMPTAEAPSNGQLPTSQGRYRLMRLSPRFEETMHDQHGDGQVPGPLHLSIGQEAVAVGACWGLRTTDAVLSTHRGHHHSLAKGR